MTNRGDEWRESRRSLQPLFHQDALESYQATMQRRIEESLERRSTEFAGQSFPINREILALPIRITCSTLFGYLPSFDEALEAVDAIWVLQSDGMRRHLAGLDYLPWLPVPLNRRVEGARRAIVQLAKSLQSAGAVQPPDEILSILFAGTESPANTLCWGLKLLQDHPDWKTRLVDWTRNRRKGMRSAG